MLGLLMPAIMATSTPCLELAKRQIYASEDCEIIKEVTDVLPDSDLHNIFIEPVPTAFKCAVSDSGYCNGTFTISTRVAKVAEAPWDGKVFGWVLLHEIRHSTGELDEHKCDEYANKYFNIYLKKTYGKHNLKRYEWG